MSFFGLVFPGSFSENPNRQKYFSLPIDFIAVSIYNDKQGRTETSETKPTQRYRKMVMKKVNAAIEHAAETKDETMEATTAPPMDTKTPAANAQNVDIQDVINFIFQVPDHATLQMISMAIKERDIALKKDIESRIETLREQLKSFSGDLLSTPSKVLPIINPKDETQFYTHGRHPEWLSELLANSGKTVAELRKEQVLLEGK